MSSLLIHIGSHKTGTTSIQRACMSYLAAGVEEPTSYINIRPTGNKIVNTRGSGGDFRASVDITAASRQLRPGAFRRSQTEGPRTSKFIISDEDFFWISEPDSVHKLAAILRERYAQIHILSYLRRQDQLAVSHRKQVSAGGNMSASRFYGVATAPLPTFQSHFHRYFDYAAKLADIWVSAFGKDNVTVIPFEGEALIDGDVVSDFAVRAGVRFDLPEQVHKNSAREGDRTIVALKLAEYGLPQQVRRRIINALPGFGKYLPSKAAAEQFLSHFAASNERLGRDWIWNGAPLTFSPGFEMYPETEESGWTNESIERMLDAVVSGLKSRVEDD